MTSNVPETILERYTSRTKLSREHDSRAKRSLPGGDTRTSTYFGPYPSYMQRGEGCYLYDLDGNRYIDYLNNFTSLIHGHAYAPIVEAAGAQLKLGTVFGAAGVVQYELAEIICDRVPSIDLVRFTNSGTEATLMAMRAARAFTGKDIIVKMDGGYHGEHDFVGVNFIPDFESPDQPQVRISWPGVPACVKEGMMVARFNDLDSTERILKEHHDKIAAVIMEPMLGAGGAIPPKPGYLQAMRQLTEKYGALLIFDEIITFRLSLGGVQLVEGVKPDLTCLGKIIGGGFAVGAFGGRKDIMDLFAPGNPKNIYHAGTFNGLNITMAAGKAAMEHFGQAEIDRINGLGARLTVGFNGAFKKAGLKGRAAGLGSALQIRWTDEEVTTAKQSILSSARAGKLPSLLHLELMNRGVYSAGRGLFCISTPMTEKDIDQATESLEGALELLKPYAAETAPHLIAA
jgi:glutamate-1-semialdehyde 2,1-aminomutase